jgi:hypothetical protein
VTCRRVSSPSVRKGELLRSAKRGALTARTHIIAQCAKGKIAGMSVKWLHLEKRTKFAFLSQRRTHSLLILGKTAQLLSPTPGHLGLRLELWVSIPAAHALAEHSFKCWVRVALLAPTARGSSKFWISVHPPHPRTGCCPELRISAHAPYCLSGTRGSFSFKRRIAAQLLHAPS